MDTQKSWVDFRLVKERVSMTDVLAHYNVNWLRKSGSELRGKCPIHKGEGERTFHANLNKNAFNCFSCKARGNVLDFVAAMEQCTVRDAALKLAEWFKIESISEVGESADGNHSGSPSAKPQTKSAAEKKSKPKEQRPAVVNPPLSFQLRVDSNHEYGLTRGLTAETMATFGAGLCLSKGTFAGRFVIPLHDEQGILVGYAGRSLDDSEPKYLFPSRDKGFYKSELVFNLHRTLKSAGADDPVVIVEGFFDCMKLVQVGFHAVSLLGSSLSSVQEEMLVSEFGQLVLLFDGDEAGRQATEDCLKRLARRAFVHVIELPDGKQPDQYSDEELRFLVAPD
jgi:DNA primase